MSQLHDPASQVSYLQQVLSQDKRNIGIFLSAGCPMSMRTIVDGVSSPLIPDIAGLTKVVSQNLTSDTECLPFYENICAQFKSDGLSEPNIEKILSHIRSLRQVAGKDSVRGLTFEHLDKLERKICEAISAVVDKNLPNNASPYHNLAAWIGTYSRKAPVHLFTTNYDLLLEQALEDLRVPYFDGFVGSRKTFFDPHAIEHDELPSRWARLWKLHGSINWAQDDSNGVVSRGEKIIPSASRRIIHPSHLKYDESRRMPFIAMIDRLKGFLRSPSAVLIMCGYSFGDEHINSVLMEGLQGNASGAIFSLMFGKLEDYPHAIRLAEKRGNLCLLSQNAAVIGTRKANWAAKNEPDEDIHKGAISWKPINKTEEQPKQAEFLLGDFANFGSFLHALVGPNQGELNV